MLSPHQLPLKLKTKMNPSFLTLLLPGTLHRQCEDCYSA